MIHSRSVLVGERDFARLQTLIRKSDAAAVELLYDELDAATVVPEVARGAGYMLGAAGGAVVTGVLNAAGVPVPLPVGMAAGGTAGDQAVKYLTEPVVELATGLKVPDSRPLGQRVKEGAIDLAATLGFGFGGELSGVALRRVVRAPYNMEKKAILRAAPPGSGRPGVIKDLEAMALEQGVSPDVAVGGALPLATRSETVRGFFKAATLHPKSAETVGESLERTLRVIQGDFDQVKGLTGSRTVSKATAGARIQEGLRDYATQTAKRQTMLEDELLGALGPKRPTGMDNTIALIRAELEKLPPGTKGGGGIVPEDYLDLIKTIEANGGNLPFDYVRALREGIGEGTSGGLIAPTGKKTKWYDPLYGALTRDMEAAVEQAGPKAQKIWGQAQSNWAQRETRLELLRNVANAQQTHEAFNRAVAGAADGPGRLIALKASVPQQSWNDLVAVKLYDMATVSRGVDMGDETVRQFSPTRFIGNYVQMDNASKDVLFGSAGSSKLRQSLDRLARVTAALRESKAAGSGRIGASGTPQGNLYLDMLGDDGLTNVLTGGKASMARATLRFLNPLNRARRANRQALLMTDPDFVRWLADGGTKPPTPRTALEHINRLGAVATGKTPAVRNAIRGYVEEWQAALGEAGQAPAEPTPERTTNASI